MAGPMYYFPGNWGSAITDAKVAERIFECELADTIGDAPRYEQTVTNGPDNGPGLVIAVRVELPARAPNFGYYPNDQTWVHIKPKNYWIGIQTSATPTPIDLQRPQVIQDYLIKLADENDWSVMALRPFMRRGSIPQIGRMNAECEWEWISHPRYDSILKKYNKIFEGGKDTTSGWADLAIETLAINYRINKYLAMILGIIEVHHCDKIFDLAMDFPEFQAHEEAKKRGIERSEIFVTSYGELTPPASLAMNQPISTSAA